MISFDDLLLRWQALLIASRLEDSSIWLVRARTACQAAVYTDAREGVLLSKSRCIYDCLQLNYTIRAVTSESSACSFLYTVAVTVLRCCIKSSRCVTWQMNRESYSGCSSAVIATSLWKSDQAQALYSFLRVLCIVGSLLCISPLHISMQRQLNGVWGFWRKLIFYFSK